MSLSGSTNVFAQATLQDSLEQELYNSKADSTKFRLMLELTDELINIDLTGALNYARKALELSLKMRDKKSEAKASYNYARVSYETDERDKSIDYYIKSEQLAEEQGLKELQVYALMGIARYNRYVTQDSTKTVNSFFRAIELSRSMDFSFGIARSHAKLASFYTKYNRVDLCERYLDTSAIYYAKVGKHNTITHYYTEVGDKLWGVNPNKSMDLYFKGKEYTMTPLLMVSLARAHSYIGDTDIALNYLEEAIPYFRKTEKRKRMLGIAMAQLSEVYLQMGDYAIADSISDEGIKLLNNLGRTDQKGLPAMYRIKGEVMERNNNKVAALEFYTKSYNEAKRIKLTEDQIIALIRLGVFYLPTDPNKSIEVCNNAYQHSKRRLLTNLEIESCDCLHSAYKKKEQYLEALKYHEEKIILKDSLSTLKIKHDLEINKSIAQKDKQLAEEAYQKDLREKELKNQHNIITVLFISTLLGLFLVGFLLYNRLLIKKQNTKISEKTKQLIETNKRLESSNVELERFAHITSHDLKSPLRNIVSFTGLLRRYLVPESTSKKVDELIDYIENSGKRMNALIDDILNYSQLSKGEPTTIKQIDLNEIVHDISQLTQSTSQGTKVIFHISELPSIEWHYSKIFQLLKNLIENGIMYNQSDKPKIKIYTEKNEKAYSIYINDNGIGIDEQHFEKIFVMFNRLHNQSEYEGTGLGLASCKKIVEEFDGEITVSSKVNRGTTFRIDIPHNIISTIEVDFNRIQLEETTA